MFKVVLSIAILAGVAIQESSQSVKCRVAGDPHYYTFNNKRIDFQGVCRYVLVEDDLKRFVVQGRASSCGNIGATCTDEVTIKVKQLDIVIKRGGTVTVFGHDKKLPYCRRGVSIKKIGNKVTVTTDIGLTVDYVGFSEAIIEIGDKFSGTVSGICGKSNGKTSKDLVKKDGTVAQNGAEFVESWEVDKSCPKPIKVPNPCKNGLSKEKLAKDKCEVLKRPPFLACNGHVKVDSYIQDCIYDICHSQPPFNMFYCEAYADYVDACQRADVKITWRPHFEECV